MPKSIEDLEKENAALRGEVESLRAKAATIDKDEKDIAERIKLSGGMLSREQAREIVLHQREWEAHPEHPNNKGKSAPAEEPSDETDSEPKPPSETAPKKGAKGEKK